MLPANHAAAQQQLRPLDTIVAVVDEDVILRSELDIAMANLESQFSDRRDQLPPRDIFERQVLERLILTRLQVARAASMGIQISDAELDAAIADIAGQNNLTLDQLAAQVAGDGMSLADLRASVRDEITMQRMRQNFAQSRISVTEGEVDAALASEASSSQYRLAHILVGVPEGSTPEQIAQAQTRAEQLKAALDSGQIDFAAAAVRYSDSPNALEGGDLGWRSIDEIPPSFAQLISTMQAGDVFGPMRTPTGFQLVKLVESRTAAETAPATATQMQARHILIRPGEDGDNAAKATLETLRARIAGGADFAELAQENSQDEATADRGGSLGWFTQDTYGVDFGAQVAALKDGEVSAPFRTEAGWHIVKREGVRQVAAADDNARARARASIGQRKLEQEWERFLREMRGEAYVDIRLPAASGS
ncbi:MAG: peptidylprolyl isomerase [Pseudomonadota bacterium]|nr:peptidylprolyl isomerase [Pseudomonadota bacterium]